MTGRQFLIERNGDGYQLRIDFALNGKKPYWITIEDYSSFSTALLGLYEVLRREEMTPAPGLNVRQKIRRMKIKVLFDEEKVERLLVDEP